MNYGFREAYFEYFESCNFSRDNTNIDVSVFMVDLRMINMSSGTLFTKHAESLRTFYAKFTRRLRKSYAVFTKPSLTLRNLRKVSASFTELLTRLSAQGVL